MIYISKSFLAQHRASNQYCCITRTHSKAPLSDPSMCRGLKTVVHVKLIPKWRHLYQSQCPKGLLAMERLAAWSCLTFSILSQENTISLHGVLSVMVGNTNNAESKIPHQTSHMTSRLYNGRCHVTSTQLLSKTCLHNATSTFRSLFGDTLIVETAPQLPKTATSQKPQTAPQPLQNIRYIRQLTNLQTHDMNLHGVLRFTGCLWTRACVAGGHILYVLDFSMWYDVTLLMMHLDLVWNWAARL